MSGYLLDKTSALIILTIFLILIFLFSALVGIGGYYFLIWLGLVAAKAKILAIATLCVCFVGSILKVFGG